MQTSPERHLLSLNQERLWFLGQLEPNSPAYVIPGALEIKGSLQPKYLETALNTVVARHEALRTRFTEEEGCGVQEVLPELTIKLAYTSFAHAPESDRVALVTRHLEARLALGFSLTEAPLLRADLVEVSADHHILLLAVHHIVCDGWSLNIVYREIGEIYRSLTQAQTLPTQTADLQYVDYALWQRQPEQASQRERQLLYWKRQLDDVPSPLELPFARARSEQVSFQGRSVSAWVPGELRQDLVDLAVSNGATLFAVLLTATNILLHRYTARDDLVVGIDSLGRDRRELEGVVGFFVNTLPIRTKISPKATFEEHLRQVRNATLDAYSNQGVPFEQMVAATLAGRSSESNPLFQVMAIYNDLRGDLGFGDLEVSRYEVLRNTSKFDLTFGFADMPGGLEITLQYNTSLFSAAVMNRTMGHLITLLRSAIRAPQAPISELEFLGAEERRELLDGINATEEEFGEDAWLHMHVERNAARWPARVAVRLGDRAIDYATLDRQSSALARQLLAIGIKRNDVVAVCLPRVPEMLVVLLGIHKAGAAYLPIDLELPDERRQHLLVDSSVVLAFADASVRLPPSVAYADYRAMLSRVDEPSGPTRLTHPDDLAYVLYTSGSSGQPKGVQVTQRGLANYVNWAARRYPSDGLGAPVHSPLGFDLTITSLFVPLVTGGTVELLPVDDGVEQLKRILLSPSRYSLIKLTPTHLRLLTSELEQASTIYGPRAFVIGGEQLHGADLTFWRRACPDTLLLNEYGPTETVVGCCVFEAQSNAMGAGAIPIGRPIANTRIYILDSYGSPVPIGVPGELYIAGHGVAQGYINRPDQTQERFVPNPFHGGCMYRTGDLARHREDGQIEFLGRQDDQVKLRGYRIELGEIEETLMRQPGVEAAAVVLQRRDQPDASLAAFVAVQGNAQDTQTALFEQLKAFLPPYMVPASITVLEVLPRSEHGKIDRKRLEHWSASISLIPIDGPSKVDIVEEALISIWSKVLKRIDITTESDFFDLGGHSLLATQVVARIRKSLKVQLALRDFFELRTVGKIAKRLASLRHNPEIPEFQRSLEPPVTGWPLSFAQERLWFLCHLEPKSPFYNIPYVMELRGPVKPELVEVTLNELIARHGALRTRFSQRSGQSVQEVLPELRIGLLRCSATGEDPTALQRLLATEASHPFDLEAGPLIRAVLFERGHDDHLLLICVHHIVSDGGSFEVLYREFAQLYEALERGISAALPTTDVQYTDYAVWQRGWLQGDLLERQLEFWRNALRDAPPLLVLPSDRKRPAVQRFVGNTLHFELPGPLAERLALFSQVSGVTPYVTLLTTFAVLLHKQSRQSDLVVGMPVSGRNVEEVEPVVGFFVNTLPLRIRIDSNQRYQNLLEQVRDNVLEAHAHQDIPFEKIVAELDPPRSLSYNPIFQVLFSYEVEVNHDARLGAGLEVGESNLNVRSEVSKFDLRLAVSRRDGTFKASFQYNTDLFSAGRIESMIRQFVGLLGEGLGFPDKTVSSMGTLNSDEYRRVIHELAHGLGQAEFLETLTERFSAIVKAHPDRTAVTNGTIFKTYAELDRESDVAARHLAAAGVKAGHLVALIMKRSPDFLVAYMAVLKLGALVTVIDPNSSPARNEIILKAAMPQLTVIEDDEVTKVPTEFRTIPTSRLSQMIQSELPLPPSQITPTSGAQIIFTSGTTGTPKGVVLSHEGIARTVCDTNHVQFVADDVILQNTNHTFDVSLWEIWGALLHGSKLVMLSRDEVLDTSILKRVVSEERISVAFFTTTLFNQLARECPSVFASLRVLLFGGEAADPTAVAHVLDGHKPEHLINGYGPAEATILATAYEIEQLDSTSSIPLGRPISATTVYILDEWMHPVPVGTPGELYIGGPRIGLGYYHDPQLTEERFLPDPFTQSATARIYRTGDLARYRKDGLIEFLGRADHQVKIRGFRIELGEIENTIARFPSVLHTAVTVKPHPTGDQALVAYVSPKSGDHLDPQALLRWVASNLPDYMVPQQVEILAQLPVMASGKIDRLRLPEPRWSTGSREVFEAPRTRMQILVAMVWQEVLQLERVGLNDSFFRIGGHSLLAMRAVARLSGLLNWRVPLRTLFEHPTAGAFAAVTEAQMAEALGLNGAVL